MEEQKYIEGTEPLTIPQVDELYATYRELRLVSADATKAVADAKEAVVDALEANKELITEHNGGKEGGGYVTEYGGQLRRIGAATKGMKLSDKQVKTEPDDD